MKILKYFILFIILVSGYYMANYFITPKYCLKTNSILRQDELYKAAMTSLINKHLNSKKQYLKNWDYGKKHPELYNFWISSPVKKEDLKYVLAPYMDTDSINEKFVSDYGYNLQILEESFLLKNNNANIFNENSNQFNLYWSVTPPNIIYLSDCCYIKNDIKRLDFWKLNFKQSKKYLAVKQTLPFTKRTVVENRLSVIESKYLLDECGEIINY